MCIASSRSSTVRKGFYALSVLPAGQVVTPLKLHGSSVRSGVGPSGRSSHPSSIAGFPADLEQWGGGSQKFLGKGFCPSYSLSYTATTLLRVNASLTVENEAEGDEDAAQFITHLACNFKDKLEMQKECSVVHKQLTVSGRFLLSPTGFDMHGLAKRDSTHQQAALIPCPLRTHQGRTYPLLFKISGKLSSE